ncbi:hypothetical protein chiPu_0025217 [Chiloscyllium punctatum]|uniref:Uncharacterized protein n=1 Tax=Chiloscyllium punctatum TaxID=137246 RepID=A0A401TF35_CHIPU|nr:hypothetical protein [Chiloscyllium punctatum]
MIESVPEALSRARPQPRMMAVGVLTDVRRVQWETGRPSATPQGAANEEREGGGAPGPAASSVDRSKKKPFRPGPRLYHWLPRPCIFFFSFLNPPE